MTDLHVVALSGGKDSTAMALRLHELNPEREYVYICTPTGNELPAMFEHWRRLRDLLGNLTPVVAGTLDGIIKDQNMIPNFRARFCTRMLKIEPYAGWLMQQSEQHDRVYSYVGIRADEAEREAGDYSKIPDVEMLFPMIEWGWTLSRVVTYLEERGISIPARTDCALCYHQRIGEWWTLWKDHPEQFTEGIEIEERMGHTFRSPKRDSWPLALKDLKARFDAGDRPRHGGQRDIFAEIPVCRVCRM